MQLAAVIFDFDGLIFDSETPVYQATASTLLEMGHQELSESQWSACIGLTEDDSWAALCTAVGRDVDRQEFEARFRSQDHRWRDEQPAVPGIESLVAELFDAGVSLGVASSSSSRWVEGTLTRLGLLDMFGAVACGDTPDCLPKPAPDLYLHAAAALGAPAARTIALEDSAPGIAAAKAAGLSVVAVPSAITIHSDLSSADHAVAKLAELNVALLDVLVQRF